MRITLVGMGMGAPGQLTADARAALLRADAVLGAERLLAPLREEGVFRAAFFADALPEAVAARIADHPEWREVCAAVSGDAGFFSAATRARELLAGHDVTTLCGISSPQYFAARLGRPWQEFRLASAHGRDCDVLAEALNHPAVFFLAGGALTPREIARELCRAGLGDARMTVGENLASANETVAAGSAAEMSARAFAPLAVALVENSMTFTRESRAGGIEDSAFIRGNAPMTKREVRAAALSLLAPRENSILWDVGAGTGSVAVEMALMARRGRVHAIECDAGALHLLEQNRQRFGVYNMTPVFGSAPDALAALPAPEAVFVGGGGGALPAIVAIARKKNPSVRLAASAVTLETLSRAVEALRREGDGEPPEVVQIAVTRTVRRGSSTMFDAQNPVFLISGGGHA